MKSYDVFVSVFINNNKRAMKTSLGLGEKTIPATQTSQAHRREINFHRAASSMTHQTCFHFTPYVTLVEIGETSASF
jgi:hypothetical protein